MAARKSNWYCADRRNCDAVLGQVVDNELVVDLDSVMTINTNGTSLVVTCARCGNPKIWFPSVEDNVLGLVNALKREFRTMR